MNKKIRYHLTSTIPLILLIVLTLSYLQCQRSNPDDAPPFPSQKEFVKLYAEILIIKNRPGKTQNADSLIAELLTNYGMSDTLYEDILAYYQENPEKWIMFLEEVDSLVVRRGKVENGGS